MDFSSLFLNPKSLLGNEKVWMAFSDDVATFNKYRSNIQSHLTHSGIPESSQSLWIGLYRIGKSRNEAKTVVVVSCTNQRIRKLTREALRSCPHFEQGGPLAQFKIISKATPPETTCEPVPTMQVDNEPSDLPDKDSKERFSYNQFSGPGPGEHRFSVCLSRDISATGNDYLGGRILARQQSEQGTSISQSATAGPLILVDGHSYQLTVQHVANFDYLNTHSLCNIANDWDDEDDEQLERGYSSDEDLASWNASTSLSGSRASSCREISDAVFSDSSSLNSFNPNFKYEEFRNINLEARSPRRGSTASPSGPSGLGESYDALTQGTASLLRPTTLDERYPLCGSAEMDYILIPVDIGSEHVSGSAEIIRICGYFHVYQLTEARSVIITTAVIGYVRGAMFPAPTFSRSPRSQTFQTLFCVESEKTMPKGASGSAVFDGETGLLAGYIILGCPTEGIWYMTPISAVLGDLQDRLGVEASCQIQLDVPAAQEASQGAEDETKSLSILNNNPTPAILEAGDCNTRSMSQDSINPEDLSKGEAIEDVLGSPDTVASDQYLTTLTFENGFQSTEEVIVNQDLECNFISYSCLLKIRDQSGKAPCIISAPPIYREVLTPAGILAPIRYLIYATVSWNSPNCPLPPSSLYFVIYKGCEAGDDMIPVLGRSWVEKCEESVGSRH